MAVPSSADSAWYLVNAHTGGSTRQSATVYYNLNAGDPGKWLYTPDLGRREYSDRTFDNASGRITWQLTPRNRISAFWDTAVAVPRLHGRDAGARRNRSRCRRKPSASSAGRSR